MCGRIWIQRIYTDDLVVSARSQIFPIRREANGVDRARVMAYGSQLSGFFIIWIVRVENRFGGPNSNVAIYKIIISNA